MKDLIERQAAINEVLSFLVEYCGAAFDEDMQNKLYQRLILLPSVTPKPFHNIEIRDVLAYIDHMPEDVWQEFVACLECRGWELTRRTAKWCGGEFA